MNQSMFTGSVGGFIIRIILLFIITFFTLGLAYPWGEVIFRTWVVKNTIIDGKRLYFDGTGLQLFGSYIKWWFFCIITLGIYSFWLFNAMTAWRVKHTHFVITEEGMGEISPSVK